MAELKPITRKEALLDNIAGGENAIRPVTREEQFLAAMAGDAEAPSPITRTEYFMAKAAENAGGGGGDLLFYDTFVTAPANSTSLEFPVMGTVVAWCAWNNTIDGSKVFACACLDPDNGIPSLGMGAVFGGQVGDKYVLNASNGVFQTGRFNFIYLYRGDAPDTPDTPLG